MAYRVKDLTHCYVPRETPSILTAIMRSKSNLSLHPIILHHELLGRKGKVIRMTQLSPDSWMLIEHLYDDRVSNKSIRESPTLDNAGWVSSSRSDAASHDTNRLNDGDEEYDEDMSNYKVNATENEVHFRQRTHVLWLESDDLRLLAYGRDMIVLAFRRVSNYGRGAYQLQGYTRFS